MEHETSLHSFLVLTLKNGDFDNAMEISLKKTTWTTISNKDLLIYDLLA